MATKKNSYITAELEFAEEQLETWKKYIQDNPIEEIVDRMDYKETKNGGMIRTVVQTKEAVIKSLRDTLKEYLALLEVVDRLREAESKKVETRGKSEISALAEEFLNKR